MHGVFTRFLKKGIMTLEIECVYKEYNCHVSIELNSVDWVTTSFSLSHFLFTIYLNFQLKNKTSTP